ncbi:MAG: hypothetical protein L0G46_11280 [Kocuria sp.]|nr:hypothetical protein [Kocuria sp.]
MIANPDRTLVAVYTDHDAHYSRPIVSIDDDGICYVTDEWGDLTPADEFDDLLFIDSAVINGEDHAA